MNQPHMTFVGRWTPFHKGHTALINTKREENPDLPVLILIRATDYDSYNPVTRAEMIKMWMGDNKVLGTIMIIPDVEGVYWGRGVGYNVEKIDLDEQVQQISASKIRKGIGGNGKKDWGNDVATVGGAQLSKPVTSTIVEKGMVVWLTGCPSAGKTTIAKELGKRVSEAHPFLKVQLLDGDVIRNSPMAERIGFSPEDRALHIRRMGQLAKMFADHGILVIAAFVSPNKDVRADIRDEIGKKRFVEVFINASKTVRIARDVKGLYKKAINGEIENLTGFNAPYDRPATAKVICNTHKESVEESTQKVLEAIFY
ncbi:adenylyl-sulfate kinase [Pseudomonadota bacterium]